MSIERLNRAAMAAGFAMAAPDDDEMDAVANPAPRTDEAPGRQVAVYSPPSAHGSAPDMLTVASMWLRGLLPASMGGRATA